MRSEDGNGAEVVARVVRRDAGAERSFARRQVGPGAERDDEDPGAPLEQGMDGGDDSRAVLLRFRDELNEFAVQGELCGQLGHERIAERFPE